MGTAVTRTAGWWALAAIVVTAVTLLAGSAPRGTRHGAGDLVWVTKRNTGTVAVIDPTTDQVTARIRVAGFPSAVAVG